MQKNSLAKLDCFSSTMTDLLRACFSGTDNYYFEGTESIDFFLYMAKYNKENDLTVDAIDRNTLVVTLASERGKSDTPEILGLFAFLNLHLLKKKDTSIRKKSYCDKAGHSFIQKPFTELAYHCKNKLKLEPTALKNITTQDSIIDIITICYLIGRHGFTPQKPLQLFHELFPADIKSTLPSLLNTPTHFTVIYGTIIERQNDYILKYIQTQLYDISHYISYNSYQNNELPKGSLLEIPQKYEELTPQLYPAILNAYLIQNKEHYFIIHDIPSQDALDNLIKNCQLYKNILLICDFDISSPENSKYVSYLPFHDFYSEPNVEDINFFFKKNKIEIDNPDEMSKTLLIVSKGNLFLLHALILLIQNLWNNKKETIKELKENLDTLSVKTDKTAIPTNKFSMNTPERTGNNLIGHIRKIYKNILSIDEWLLVLLTALHGKDGLPEELLINLYPKNTDNNPFNTMASLVEMNLIRKENNNYFYEDSLLIPYALFYGKQNIENNFSEVFTFLNFMLDEICYHNATPIDYSVLCTTIKKTHKTTFSLLHKSSIDYKEHFAEIWYYHIRCLKFFLENGEFTAIEKLNDEFNSFAKKLTSRPGKEYKHWKKLYAIYLDFLNLNTQSVTNPSSTWKPHISMIDKLITHISTYGLENLPQPEYLKLLFSLIEMNITYPFQLCVSGLWEKRILQEKNAIELYIKKLQLINSVSRKMLLQQSIPKDKIFLSEIKTTFQTITQLTDIYIQYSIYEQYNTYIQSHNWKIPCINKFIQPPYTAPRYMQLSYFQKYCVLLSEQCYSGYIQINFDKDSKVHTSPNTLVKIYSKLETVPINILEDYYCALINYTLLLAPSDTDKLLDYIYTDFKRYKHTWQHSEILTQIQNIISELSSKFQS